ncbi:MAG: RNA polymerase sigma factor [Myxococcales bacterium]
MPSVPNAATPDDEAELLARCREGDRGAFRALYARHFARVHGTARRLGTPPAELDDVTQEVFASAFGKLDRFGGGSFGNWLHRICHNVVTDHHRKRNVREAFRRIVGAPQENHAEGPSPETAASAREASAQVSAILSRMRPKQREVFALFELEGLSGEEISERVGCPVNTVWTRLHHARLAFVKIGRKRGYIEVESAE